MVENKKGLIVNVSSYGGLECIDTPPYGIGKVSLRAALIHLDLNQRISNMLSRLTHLPNFCRSV